MNAALIRRQTIILAAGLSLWGGSVAMADWDNFWKKIHLGTHRNLAWPDPFNEADAMQVVMPFEVMKQNGWRAHNTIGHELFRAGDGALLASGQNRVRWIATQAPPTHREIHVLEGVTAKETEARMSAVRDAISGLTVEGQEPQIFITRIQPGTASGAWATKINRDRLEQMAAPKLPTTTAAGSAGATE